MRFVRKTRGEYQDRAATIRQMHDAGASNKDIALAVSMSREALRLVFKKFDAERVAEERGVKLLREIRLLDDLDRKWKMDTLLDALNLTTRARTSITSRCEWNKIDQLSIREFMELVISDKPHAKPGCLLTPLVKGTGVVSRHMDKWDLTWRATADGVGSWPGRCASNGPVDGIT